MNYTAISEPIVILFVFLICIWGVFFARRRKKKDPLDDPSNDIYQ